MNPELLAQLTAMQTDFTAFIAKVESERKEFGTVSAETTLTLKNIQERIDAMEQKATKITPPERKTMRMVMEQNEDVQRLMKDKRGRSAQFTLNGEAAMELLEGKEITRTGVGYATSGVMPEERGRYVEEARVALGVRDVIPSRPTVLAKLTWPKASITGTKASPVAESALKPVNTYDPTMVEAYVKKIATYFDASQEVLADWSELEGILRSLGSYKVNHEVERQLLFGDNTGENLNGLTNQAQAFSLTGGPISASGGYTYVDMIAQAAAQVAADNEVNPTFAIVNTANFWRMQLTKDANGNYVLGGPTSGMVNRMWGLRIVPTNMMTAGSFLVGSGSPVAAEIRDRMELSVMMSTEHANNFTYNLVTILFEARLALAVYRPDAFVYGSLVQSPA